MLTQEQNEALTCVGPGTPMGNLMRRYWHPVAAAANLAVTPLQAVRLLGESLVLYRAKRGNLGLLAEACPHRGASLARGTLENQGVRCAQHGWLYDSEGQCLEQPMEPANSTPPDAFRTTAYPVQELGGLVFAYLGPEPKPLLARYNVLVWDDAVRETNGTTVPCNWLQVMENLLDPLHVEFLHGRYFAYVLERKGGDQLQEFMAHHYPPSMKKIGFDLFEHGIVERHIVISENDPSWATGTPSFFPTTSLLGSSGKGGTVIFVVPIDDAHTWLVVHMAQRTGLPVAQESIPFFDVRGEDLAGAFITDTANGQDHMAVVTQGSIARRDVERLGTSDLGIVLYRELLMGQIDRLERGEDPINVRRDPAENHIIDFPGARSEVELVDTTGWSRQRRRWAARHNRGQQAHRELPLAAPQPGPSEQGQAVLHPPILREHREVVIR